MAIVKPVLQKCCEEAEITLTLNEFHKINNFVRAYGREPKGNVVSLAWNSAETVVGDIALKLENAGVEGLALNVYGRVAN